MFLIFNAVFFSFNLLMVPVFFYFRWSKYLLEGYFYRTEKFFVAGYVILMLVGWGISALKKNLRPPFLILNFSQSLVILCFLLMEILFSAFPALLPKGIARLVPQLNPMVKEVKTRVLEALDESPWVKFKPNVEVKVYDNDEDDYCDAWMTDPLGFKNSPEISALSNVEALAIGDSFVEGAGVPTEKTWPTLVSKRGTSIYNFGVEGYAPQQAVGALRKYGKNFKTKHVIFGYTPGFEHRALYFSDSDFSINEKLLGNAHFISRYRKLKMVNSREYFKITNAIFDFYKCKLVTVMKPSAPILGRDAQSQYGSFFDLCRYKLKEMIKPRSSISTRDSPFSLYYAEIESNRDIVFNPKKEQWRLMTQSILDAKKITEEMNAILLILIFYSRNLVYYQELTKAEIPMNHYELKRAGALKEFCHDHGIEVIDTLPAFRKYMGDLPEPMDVAKLPYFREDAHMNEIGHELVAETVLEYLKNQPRRH